MVCPQISIELGNLTGALSAGNLEFAGLHSTDLKRVLPKAKNRSKKDQEIRLGIGQAGSFGFESNEQ